MTNSGLYRLELGVKRGVVLRELRAEIIALWGIWSRRETTPTGVCTDERAQKVSGFSKHAGETIVVLCFPITIKISIPLQDGGNTNILCCELTAANCKLSIVVLCFPITIKIFARSGAQGAQGWNKSPMGYSVA